MVYGIRGVAHEFFKSYLNGWSHTVCIICAVTEQKLVLLVQYYQKLAHSAKTVLFAPKFDKMFYHYLYINEETI